MLNVECWCRDPEGLRPGGGCTNPPTLVSSDQSVPFPPPLFFPVLVIQRKTGSEMLTHFSGKALSVSRHVSRHTLFRCWLKVRLPHLGLTMAVFSDHRRAGLVSQIGSFGIRLDFCDQTSANYPHGRLWQRYRRQQLCSYAGDVDSRRRQRRRRCIISPSKQLRPALSQFPGITLNLWGSSGIPGLWSLWILLD